MKLDIADLDAAEISERLKRANLGEDIGQIEVARTKTKSLKDIFGWLLESHRAGEFDEATRNLCDAVSILDRLSA